MNNLPAWAQFYLGCGFVIGMWLLVAAVVGWVESR